MGPHERKARKQCARALRLIERHFAHYDQDPSETGFAKQAGCSPYAVSNLRKGKLVKPSTLDKLLAHVAKRDKARRGDEK